MSIATLKRKTQNTIQIASANRPNFSINGTRRSQGYIGQTSLSQSLSRTLMKGNVIKGCGGCCGEYNIAPLVKANVSSLNNPDVIKSSVLNTRGLIHTKYRWILRPQPFSKTEEITDYVNDKSQSAYIAKLVIKSTKETEVATKDKMCNQLTKMVLKCIPFSTHLAQTDMCMITKPGHITISESEYLLKLKQYCKNDISSTKLNKTPFGC